MTDRIAKLIAVKTAVEAGVWDHDTVARWLWSQTGRLYGFAHAAFNGYTDHAIALMAAVEVHDRLEMFRADDGTWGVNLGERDTVFHPVLSVALLLAILSALIEREGHHA